MQIIVHIESLLHQMDQFSPEWFKVIHQFTANMRPDPGKLFVGIEGTEDYMAHIIGGQSCSHQTDELVGFFCKIIPVSDSDEHPFNVPSVNCIELMSELSSRKIV